MAKVFLETGDDFRIVNDNTTIYGVSGDDTDSIIIEQGTTGVTVNANVDRIDFAGNIADFRFEAGFGANMMVYSADGTTLLATIPLQEDANGTQLVFADGAVASIFTAGTGITTGGVALTDTPAAIAPAAENIDTTVTTEADLDPVVTTPTFSVAAAAASVTEGGSATFTVTLSSAVTTGATTVNYTLAGVNGAVLGTDTTTVADGTLTFAANETTKTITVPISLDDLSPETGEGVSLTLSSPSVGTAVAATPSATVTITDVPVTYTMTASAANVYEGAAITYTLTASANATADKVIAFSVVPGDTAALDQGTDTTNLNDFAAGAFNPSNVTMLAGTKTATFTVTSSIDTKTELPENYSVKAVIGTTTVATATTSLLDGNGIPVTGQTYPLTTGVDTVIGAATDDTIDGAISASWSNFDTIDGGAGIDTMNALITGTTAPGSATVTNVEVLNVNTTGAGFTLDTTSGYAGLTSFKVNSSAAGAISYTGATTTKANLNGTLISSVDVIGTGGDLNISTGIAAVTVGGTAVANALTSATVTGGSTIAITDRSGTAAATGSTLKTVSVIGNASSEDITITANGLTTLNLTTLKGAAAVGDTVITAAAGTRALTVNYNGVDVAGDGAVTGGALTVTDGEATSLAIKAVTAKTYDVTTSTAKATAVTIDAAVALQMTALTAGVATTLGISGAGAVSIAADTLAATAVVTSTNTGGVTLTQALTANQQFVGTSSTGNDVVGFAISHTKANSTGAGNDTVTYSGALTGGTIDAGADTDTIKMTAALAAIATATTTFAGTVSNFEVLEFSATTGGARAINMANADGINALKTVGVDTGALTVTNAAAGFTYTSTDVTSSASSIAYASDTGTNDTINVNYAAADGFTDTAATTIGGVENLIITTDDTDTTAATTAFTALLTGTAFKDVKISGDTGLIFTNTNTAITSLDASGLTGTTDTGVFGLTWDTGALAASSVIKGSASATNAVDFTLAATASTFVTYTGGSGTDTIIGSNGLNNVVNLGDGTNSYTQTNAGNATITGGSGVDTITIGSGANTVNVGGGATNTVLFGTAMAGLNVITLGAGVDTLDFNAVSTAAGYYPSVIGIAAGDKIDFVGASAGAGATVDEATMGAKISLGAAASFANYLDAANAGNGSVNAIANWFQFDGNTYVTLDNAIAATYSDGVDLVVQLQGVVDLTNSTLASEVLTIV